MNDSPINDYVCDCRNNNESESVMTILNELNKLHEAVASDDQNTIDAILDQSMNESEGGFATIREWVFQYDDPLTIDRVDHLIVVMQEYLSV